MTPLKEIVRAARRERGMSLTEFAMAVGISESALASVEYGGRPIRPTIEKLAAYLQRPAAELDPDGTAIQRRSPKRREVPEGLRAVGQLIEQVRRLHDEFTVAHERAIAAVRTNDLSALAMARQRQSDLLAEQSSLIDAFVTSSRSVGADLSRPTDRSSALLASMMTLHE